MEGNAAGEGAPQQPQPDEPADLLSIYRSPKDESIVKLGVGPYGDPPSTLNIYFLDGGFANSYTQERTTALLNQLRQAVAEGTVLAVELSVLDLRDEVANNNTVLLQLLQDLLVTVEKMGVLNKLTADTVILQQAVVGVGNNLRTLIYSSRNLQKLYLKIHRQNTAQDLEGFISFLQDHPSLIDFGLDCDFEVYPNNGELQIVLDSMGRAVAQNPKVTRVEIGFWGERRFCPLSTPTIYSILQSKPHVVLNLLACRLQAEDCHGALVPAIVESSALQNLEVVETFAEEYDGDVDSQEGYHVLFEGIQSATSLKKLDITFLARPSVKSSVALHDFLTETKTLESIAVSSSIHWGQDQEDNLFDLPAHAVILSLKHGTNSLKSVKLEVDSNSFLSSSNTNTDLTSSRAILEEEVRQQESMVSTSNEVVARNECLTTLDIGLDHWSLLTAQDLQGIFEVLSQAGVVNNLASLRVRELTWSRSRECSPQHRVIHISTMMATIWCFMVRSCPKLVDVDIESYPHDGWVPTNSSQFDLGALAERYADVANATFRALVAAANGIRTNKIDTFLRFNRVGRPALSSAASSSSAKAVMVNVLIEYSNEMNVVYEIVKLCVPILFRSEE